ncbi:uncharacterized protein LOC111705167 [Eurytemora carolleeae]|uniref:uncharacterized protein LOC111705167 n=1 Tax=Eurytemora carolleeae TaxID=1294199 RepID=UPI000C762471|nr:uncharacterized protein LOC111705167 [Eurytemora carolleeae]|eukprot:XP_023333397.1 uncharacterized protein LOC111705167 [Eurytemora affinis]
MGFISALSRICLDMTVVTFLILWFPWFPPYTTYTQFEFPGSPAWAGPLEKNDKLNIVDKLFENQIKGPESFAIKDGYLYTGIVSFMISLISSSVTKLFNN